MVSSIPLVWLSLGLSSVYGTDLMWLPDLMHEPSAPTHWPWSIETKPVDSNTRQRLSGR